MPSEHKRHRTVARGAGKVEQVQNAAGDIELVLAIDGKIPWQNATCALGTLLTSVRNVKAKYKCASCLP
jgi:hypothetical protein